MTEATTETISTQKPQQSRGDHQRNVNQRPDEAPAQSNGGDQVRCVTHRICEAAEIPRGDQGARGNQRDTEAPRDLTPILGELRETYRTWTAFIKAARTLHLQQCAQIRRMTDCKKSESPKILKGLLRGDQAALGNQRNYEASEHNGGDQGCVVTQTAHEAPGGNGEGDHGTHGNQTSNEALAVLAVILPLQQAEQSILEHAEPKKARMLELVEMLPAWKWVENCRGVSGLLFAQIVGEAGDLANYTPGGLNKRFGVALVEVNGERVIQRRSSEHADVMGYCPRRRSLLWKVGSCLIKCGNAHYREIYDTEKARQLEGGATTARAHNRAKRYMEKRWLRDLRNAWLEATTFTTETMAKAKPQARHQEVTQ